MNTIRPLVSRGAAIALMFLLLSGCRADTKRATGPPAFGDQAELVAWVKVAPAEFRAGETVQVEVGVRNPTKYPIIMGFTSGCRLSYAVMDARHATVAPGFACPLNAPTTLIAAGETLAAHFAWDGTDYSGASLSPGEYQVRSAGFLSPSATPVTIRILAR